MAKEKVVHWSVPVACKLIPGDAVPPVCVEAAIREIGEFRQEIEDTFPDDIPTLPGVLAKFTCLQEVTYHHIFHHKWKD
jgi:hypothetical protein